MAYNNGFPTTYAPVYYTPYTPVQGAQTAQQPAQSNSIIWVSGEGGAKAYLVAPNTTVQLWDSEAQTIYLKSADASGMPSMKVLDYTIRDLSPANPHVGGDKSGNTNHQEYATKAELEALTARLNTLKDEINNAKKKGVNLNE